MEPPEVPDELDRQLEQYFAASPEAPTPAGGSAEVLIPSEIRAQVIEGVVDRILLSWGAPNGEIPATIKSEVIARLVEHVLGELLKKSATRVETERAGNGLLKDHAGPEGTLQRNTSSLRVFTALVRRSASVLISA